MLNAKGLLAALASACVRLGSLGRRRTAAHQNKNARLLSAARTFLQRKHIKSDLKFQ